MAKRVLLFSPIEDFLINPKEFMPLGLLYISSYLKQHGYEADVIHGNFSDIKKEYDIYGISSTTPQYAKAKFILHSIKQSNKNSRVILGGAHTNSPKCVSEAIAEGFDQVVVGQGEKSLVRILQGLEDNKVVSGEPLNKIEIDNLLPDREALNINEYSYPLNNGRAATLITGRGCPYKCSFCTNCQDRLTFRSPDRVIEEVDLLVKKYGFNKLLFVDDSFTLKKNRVSEILNGLKKYNLEYRCYARTDNSSDQSLLELLKESGCIELGAGIESGSQKILDLINKRTKVTENLDFIQRAQTIGIDINSFIMIGLPGESRETILATREFMQKAKPKKFGYNIFVPTPDCSIVVDYETPFLSGPYKGKSFKDFIYLYPIPYEKLVTKTMSIDECFVSTPDLSREDIFNTYKEEFERFIKITGFDPRKRGNRNSIIVKT